MKDSRQVIQSVGLRDHEGATMRPGGPHDCLIIRCKNSSKVSLQNQGICTANGQALSFLSEQMKVLLG